MSKWILILLAIAQFQIVSAAPLFARDNPFLVMDVSSGNILSSYKQNDRWYPASLTKLMSAYVTMQALKKGEITIASPVRISANANKMPASRMGYKTGTLLRIDTALKILIVKSANDVAVALAESVAGSVDKFVAKMNTTASELGMKNSHFTNPNGLHSKAQYSSAHDLALLSRRILIDFPQYAHWFAIPAIRTSQKTHYSYNLLLERFSGANGMKTGFVCASGYNMVASATRAGLQLIAVVLGEESQSARAILAAKLLENAFSDPTFTGNFTQSAQSAKTTSVSAPPVNMRPILCTQKARKQRYEPGAGKAVIKSTYLNKRQITTQPVLVKAGNTTGSYLAAQRVPVPIRRPGNLENQLNSATTLRPTIPLPQKRPVL